MSLGSLLQPQLLDRNLGFLHFLLGTGTRGRDLDLQGQAEGGIVGEAGEDLHVKVHPLARRNVATPCEAGGCSGLGGRSWRLGVLGTGTARWWREDYWRLGGVGGRCFVLCLAVL